MADSEVKVNCSYCKSSVKNKKVICKNCLTPFHKSCAIKKTKKCCEKQQFDESEDPELCVAMEDTENPYLIKEQNKLLKQMISDKEVIIADKVKLINLLEEKAIKLEIELENIRNNINDKSQIYKKHDLNTEVNKEFEVNKHKQNIKTPKHKETKNSTNHEYEKLRKGDNMREIEDAQVRAMQNLIYINNDEENLQNKNNKQESHKVEEKEFKTVTYKKNKSNMKYKVGQGEVKEDMENKAFTGRAQEKRVWVFLSKVNDHVTEEIIKKYLETEVQNKELTHIEEINTLRKIKDNKCFKIGLEYKLKDKVYSTSFWPRGVAFQKYNFKKGERYTKRINEEKGNFLEEQQLQQSE